jgi:hypothetical protein
VILNFDLSFCLGPKIREATMQSSVKLSACQPQAVSGGAMIGGEALVGERPSDFKGMVEVRRAVLRYGRVAEVGRPCRAQCQYAAALGDGRVEQFGRASTTGAIVAWPWIAGDVLADEPRAQRASMS